MNDRFCCEVGQVPHNRKFARLRMTTNNSLFGIELPSELDLDCPKIEFHDGH